MKRNSVQWLSVNLVIVPVKETNLNTRFCIC